MEKDKGEQHNLAYDPAYTKILNEHRALLDDYIQRTKDDYRNLKTEADKRWRSHTPGYPHHEGPCSRDITNRK